MKKLLISSLSILTLTSCSYMAKENVDKIEHVDKASLQSEEINEKVASIDDRLSALEKEIDALKSAKDDILLQINSLQKQINQLKEACPGACNGRIAILERDVAELKEKVEKLSVRNVRRER